MKGLLIRVAADVTKAGGGWNGPVDSATREFVYVSIREFRRVRRGFETPYQVLNHKLKQFGLRLPERLQDRLMHLDPDFKHLTYGDSGRRGKQISKSLGRGDIIAFYAALRDVKGARRLLYALIGYFEINRIERAVTIPVRRAKVNAHTRRILPKNSEDIVVWARKGVSGRFDRCLPIGEYRDGAYRVGRDILKAWGDLKVRDGYIQRSGTLPEFLDADRFDRWLKRQHVKLIRRNN